MQSKIVNAGPRPQASLIRDDWNSDIVPGILACCRQPVTYETAQYAVGILFLISSAKHRGSAPAAAFLDFRLCLIYPKKEKAPHIAGL
jgi:hypothetical protein